VDQRAFVGQAEAPRRAVEQAHAEVRLQCLDHDAHACLRHPQRQAGTREAAQLHHAGEDFHALETVDQGKEEMVRTIARL
jgi:hypothetical protein